MKKTNLLVVLVLLLLGCNLAKEDVRLGASWVPINTGNNSFIPRRNFGTAVIDGKIIVIGGYMWKNFREELANDVWMSKDEGKTWEEIKNHSSSPTETFTKRQKFGTVVIGKDIYIIGGYSDSGVHLNDVRKSSDEGQTWVEIVKNAEFPPRYGHRALVLGNSIYVIGGFDGRTYYKDVWESTDFGKTWEELDNIPFRPRQGFGAVVYKDELLIIGGQNPDTLTDVWRSIRKETTWYKQRNIPFEFFEQEIVKVEDDLFVIEQDHVWKSIDEGQEWIKVVFEAPFNARVGYGMVTIGRKLILFGGRNPTTGKYLNDTWESSY